MAIVGLAWSAVMLLAKTPELRVALPEVRTLAGRPQHAIVRSDGAIVVSGQFAGNEGDPFSNLLVLGSDGRVLKRLPPLLYAREPGSYEAYRPQYRYCDIAFEDGTFIVETETTISIGDYSTSLNRPIHLNADGTVDEGFNARFGTNAAVFGAGSIVQSDGKLLFAGAFDGVPVRRIFPDGSPDPGFTQQVGSAGLPPVGLRMAISPNGKIWLWPGNFSSNGFTFKQLVRLNGDGSLDTGFAAPKFDVPPSIIPQSDGKLLFSWEWWPSIHQVNDTDILVIGRLNDNGSLDSGFNVDPDLLAGFVGPNEPSPNGFALMPDGKIVIGIHGAVMDGGASVQRATIKQLFPDGRLDAAFQDRLRAPCLQQLIPQTDDNLLVLHRTCGWGPATGHTLLD